MPRLALALVVVLAVAPSGVAQADDGFVAPQLIGRAVLPADTFAPGPPSGAALGTSPINGRTPPFASQPVQGFSAVLDAGNGEYDVMPDNGFGAKANSSDFLLRMYRIHPSFETAAGGSGTIEVGDFISLRDPDNKVPFPIVRGDLPGRLLTGGDFDIESVRRDRHGDLWFGDEFGPYLLHTSATGRVLEAPIALPGVKSPDNPTLAGTTPNLGSSKGIEGMALSADGTRLFVSLEGALTTDPDPQRRLIFTFDLDSERWVAPTRAVRMRAAGDSIGDLTAIDDCHLAIIERDNNQGPAAATKRIDRLDLCAPSSDGFLSRTPIVDLLDIADPHGISLPARPGDFGIGAQFKFPFQTIEDVLPIGDDRLLVLDDNNYPFSAGRNPGLPDDDEAIVLDVPGLHDGAQPDVHAASVDVQIVGLNDFHGNLEPPAGQILTPGGTRVDAGGIEYVATQVDKLRQRNPRNTIVTSSGDLVGASPLLSALFHDEPTIEAMNRLGLSLNAVGNHEFDEGSDELERMQYGGCHPVDGCQDGDGFGGADFRFLAANVVRTSTGQTIFPPYAIKQFDGVKVAFVGMTLKGTPEIVTPSGVAGLDFRDEADTVNALVPELQRQGAKTIVVLLHQGGTQTGLFNDCTSLAGPLAGIVSRTSHEVDAFLTAHTHAAYNCVVDGRPVTSAGSFGKLLTDVDLTIDRATGEPTRIAANNLAVTRDVAKDPSESAIVAKYGALSAPLANRVIGTTSAALTRDLTAAGESALGDVIADSQLESTVPIGFGGAQIALMNPGGVRADIDAGPVLYSEAFTVQPFGNTLVTMSLTGAQIERVLEQQWSATTTRILHPSRGFTYSWDPSRPAGDRINPAALKLDGVPIDPATTYRVTVNNFLADGGDGFTVLREGSSRLGGAVDLDALAAYFAAHSPVAPGPRDRIATGPYGAARPAGEPGPGSGGAPAGGGTPPPPASASTPAAAPAPAAATRTPATLAVDRTAPVISAVRLTRTRFAVSAKPTAISAAVGLAKGTTIRFTSSERASVTIAFSHAVRGRRRGSTCRPATRPVAAARRCAARVADGTLRRIAVAGANAVTFSGRIGNRALRPGRYALRVAATDLAGNRGRAKVLDVVVARG